MELITIVVPSTGPKYTDLAHTFALPSAAGQGVATIEVIAPTLQAARNEGLARVSTPFVVFLDADDELPPGYCEGAERLIAMDDQVDVWVPRVRYLHGGRRWTVPASNTRRGQPARHPAVSGHDHYCTEACLLAGNYIVIGAPVRTELAQRVGFRHFEWSEDWDFWLRLHLRENARFAYAHELEYLAHVRPDSRNRAGRADHVRHHNAILRSNGLPEV